MIYKDELGLVVDSTMDAGDSCNFTCGYWMLTGANVQRNVFFNNGRPVRHPTQAPWNNPKNFTRDQAIPLTPFLSSRQALKLLWSIVLRCGFMPNTERDYPGTTKYPWPHKVTDLGSGRVYTRKFDFADFAGPAYLGSLILQARLYPAYPIAALGWLETGLKIIMHAKKSVNLVLENDAKQLYTLSMSYGLHNVFEALHPHGVGKAMMVYWSGWRQQPELGVLWTDFVKRNYANSRLKNLDAENLRQLRLSRRIFKLVRSLLW